jgi:uncharacterized protein YjeT (DUF2065 family)
MDMIRYVFVAGPITGDGETEVLTNIRLGIDAAQRLLVQGFVPFSPHTHVAWGLVYRNSPRLWKQLDLNWLERCDALLRISGESAGAAAEVAYAELHGIPVFNSVEDLIEARENES